MAGKGVTRVGNVDIQFGQAYDMVKANQLVQSLQQVVSQVNANAQAIATVQATPAATTVPQHELAGTGGIGNVHTVAGLTAGQVLIAESPNNVVFRAINLLDLSDMDVPSLQGVTEGDVLTYQSGYWCAAAPSPFGLTNPGASAIVAWNQDEQAYGWAQPDDTLSLRPGAIGVNPSNVVHGDLANLVYVEGSGGSVIANDHPQYGLLSQPNTWAMQQTFAGGFGIQGQIAVMGAGSTQSATITLSGIEPYFQITDTDLPTQDEASWAIYAEPGMLRMTTVDDAGSWGEDWLTITRVGEVADAINLSANSFTYNGDTVLTASNIAPGVKVWFSTDAYGRLVINAA